MSHRIQIRQRAVDSSARARPFLALQRGGVQNPSTDDIDDLEGSVLALAERVAITDANRRRGGGADLYYMAEFRLRFPQAGRIISVDIPLFNEGDNRFSLMSGRLSQELYAAVMNRFNVDSSDDPMHPSGAAILSELRQRQFTIIGVVVYPVIAGQHQAHERREQLQNSMRRLQEGQPDMRAGSLARHFNNRARTLLDMFNWQAYNTFDVSLLSSRYTDLDNNKGIVQGDGLCVLQVLEWIRNNGYEERTHCVESDLVRQREVLFSYVRSAPFTDEERKALYTGQLFTAIKAYKRVNPSMDMGFYNVHTGEIMDIEFADDGSGELKMTVNDVENEHLQVQQELFEKDAEDALAILQRSIFRHEWWIIYERMHVVPLSREQMRQLYNELQMSRKLSATVRKALSHRAVAGKQHRNEDVIKLRNVYDYRRKYECEREDQYMGEGRHVVDWGSKPKTFVLEKCITPAFIDKQFSLRRKRNPQLTREKVEQIYEFNLSGEALQSAVKRIKKQIKRVGVAAMDIETVIDNSSTDFIGNVKPVALCVYGTVNYDKLIKERYARLKEQVESDVGITCEQLKQIFYEDENGEQQQIEIDDEGEADMFFERMEESEYEEDDADDEQVETANPHKGGVGGRVQQMHVDVSFTGYDCVQQFVEWLVQEGVIAQEVFSVFTNKNKRKYKYLRKYKNIFVAHNGARFDFRFIVDVLSKYSNIELTGTIAQMKKLSFKNLQFIDSFQLLPFSLDKLCESMQTVNKKFPYDIANIDKNNWQEKLPQIVKYCRMDCIALREAYLKFTKKRAVQYFGGRSFPKVLFPATQSQAAMDVVKNCFLQTTLRSYPETFDEESISYLGGIALLFGTKLSYGASFDENSAYSGAMHNSMPTKPLPAGQAIEGYRSVEKKYITVFEGMNEHGLVPCAVSEQLSPDWYRQQMETVAAVHGEHSEEMIKELYLWNRLDDMGLYKVQFEFPDHTKYPSLLTRQEQTLLMFLTNGMADDTWIWGVELNLAIEKLGARVYVKKEIHYKGKPVFREFITTLYAERQAVKDHDEVLQLILKLIMNTFYGKVGQKIQPKSLYGHMQLIRDFIDQNTHERSSIIVLQLKPVLAINDALFELQYIDVNEHKNQVGMLVRFASYITALARRNLFNGAVITQQLFDRLLRERGISEPSEGGLYIKYMDTDSNHVSMADGFTERHKKELDMLTELHKEANKLMHGFNDEVSKINKFRVLRREGLLQMEGGASSSSISVARVQCALYRVKMISTLASEFVEQIDILTYQGKMRRLGDLVALYTGTQLFAEECDADADVIAMTQDESRDGELGSVVSHCKESFNRNFCVNFLQQMIARDVKEIYGENYLFAALVNEEMEDPREVNTDLAYMAGGPPMIKMVDSKICGAFKIEKYIVKGYYLGAKQYAVMAFDEDFRGMLKISCKMKGVKASHRQYEHYQDMFARLNLYQTNEELEEQIRQEARRDVAAVTPGTPDSPIKKYKQLQFRVLHTGVHIAEVFKIVMPTLTKRLFMGEKGLTSRPFRDSLEWLVNKQHRDEQNQIAKNAYQFLYGQEDMMEQIQSAHFYSAQKDLVHRKDILMRAIDTTGQVKKLTYNEESGQWEFVQPDFMQLPPEMRRVRETFIGEEEMQGRLVVASPIVFNKMNFVQQLSTVFQQQALPFLEKAHEAFRDALDYYVSRYSSFIVGEKCRKVQEVRRTMIHALFMNNLLTAVYQWEQHLFTYKLVSPYKSIVEMCEAKIKKCISEHIVIALQSDYQRMIESDFSLVRSKLEELVEETASPLVKQKFDMLMQLDNSSTGQLYVRRRKRLAAGGAANEEEEKQWEMIDTSVAAVGDDPEEQKRAKKRVQKQIQAQKKALAKLQEREHMVVDANTVSRINASKKRVHAFLAHRCKHSSSMGNNTNFLLVRAELIRAVHEGRINELQNLYKQRLIGKTSQYTAILYVLRTHLMQDQDIFSGSRSAERQCNFSKMTPSIRQFLDMVIHVFFTGQNVNLNLVRGSFGVTNVFASEDELDELISELNGELQQQQQQQQQQQ